MEETRLDRIQDFNSGTIVKYRWIFFLYPKLERSS